jgi:short-subunit dehydrogenase
LIIYLEKEVNVMIKGRNTVLITGASSGIGFELSKIFAKNGYHLVLVSQNESNLKRAASDIRKQYSDAQITIIPKDLSLPSSPEEIFESLTQKSIEVDILINSAGIQVYGPFNETNLEDDLRLISLNMLALTKLTKLFLKGMVERGYGKILNLGSTGSFQPCPLNAIYCAGKAYVLHFSEGIAEELKGTGVTVTTLCPGATRTDFARRAKIEDIRLFKDYIMDAEKVAEIGYKALMKGKPVVVAGMLNKIMTSSVRFSPRGLVTKIGNYIMQRQNH